MIFWEKKSYFWRKFISLWKLFKKIKNIFNVQIKLYKMDSIFLYYVFNVKITFKEWIKINLLPRNIKQCLILSILAYSRVVS